MKPGIPPALKQDHDNLRASLDAATREPGALGEAARDLARVLEPHLAREEELVFPTLGFLPALTEGRITRDMADVLVVTQRLKKELPEMLAEHRRIQTGLEKLRAAAAAASRPAYERFADSLGEHIDIEEEVLYLTAILVGEHLALQLERRQEKGAPKSIPPWRSKPI